MFALKTTDFRHFSILRRTDLFNFYLFDDEAEQFLERKYLKLLLGQIVVVFTVRRKYLLGFKTFFHFAAD